MKQLLLALMTAGSMLSAAPAFADHASDNAAEIARLAYRLASTAENLEQASERDAGGWDDFRIESTAERGAIGVLDHRRDNLQQLYRTSRSLHLSASDLYRSSRGRFGPNSPQDHRGDAIRGSYARVRQDLDQVRYVYDRLRGQCSQQVAYLVGDVLRAYDDLEWAVYGRGRI